MGLIRHFLLAAVQHLTPFSHVLIAIGIILPGLLFHDFSQDQSYLDCLPVNITAVLASDETKCEEGDGHLQISFDDPNSGNSTYSIEFQFDGREVTLNDFLESPIIIDRLNPGTYTNIIITRTANACNSSLWSIGQKINFGCDFAELAESQTNCPTPITFIDCDGNNQTFSNLPIDKYTNVTNGVSNCLVHTDVNCNVDEVAKVKCIEANQSTPPIPPGTVTFTPIDYLSAGITALEASRINWIIENYFNDFYLTEVSQAIWHITGTSSCANGACQDIVDAAEAAIQSPNGTETQMRFFQPSISNIQVFVEWQFYEPTCDNVTDPGTISNPQVLCGIPSDPDVLGNVEEASGGSGGIEYQWLASTIECPDDLQFSIPGATGLSYDPGPISENTWFVRCARSLGCTIWLESNCIYVAVNPDVEASILISSNYNGSQISCAGADDGEATAIGIIGTPPFEYLWSDGQTTDVAIGLSAETYSVTITDDKNCTVVEEVTLTDPSVVGVTASITSNYNGTSISCSGANDGSLNAIANGGIGTYSYTWSNGQTGSDITNLGSGTYTVIASDLNGCTAEASITLEEPDALTSEAIVVSNYNGAQISCNAANDAIVLVNTTGGVLPYTYNWSNGLNSQQIENLGPGTYAVTVTDANNCSTTSQVAVVEPPLLTCSASVTSTYFEGVDISTLGGNDGAASINGTGGTGTYTYQWDDGNSQTTQNANNLSAGTYTVQVSDANGCTCSGQVTLLDPAKIGDFIFEDLNGDGIQDANEPGIEGVLITLTGTANNGTLITRSTSSGPDGIYTVDGLLPGSYKITLNLPSGFEATYANEGTDDSKDSDIDPANGMSNNITVTNGEFNEDLDAGLLKLTTIGDYTWKDCNKNGIQETGEEALGFVPVSLSGQTGNGTTVNLTTASEADGSYEFVNLKPGTYTLTFGFPNTPTGLDYSPQSQGGDDAKDSDVNANGLTNPIIISSQENNIDIDAGFMDVTPPSISPGSSDLVLECDGAGNSAAINAWLDSYGGAAATDNCSPVGGITWTNDFTQISGNCGETGAVIVTFTASDECGNNNQTTATLTIEDTTAPSIDTQASDLTVNCDGAGNISDLTNWLANNGNAAASDICGAVSWTNNYSALNNDCGASGASTVTFIATDDCGNVNQTTATFTIEDVTPPALGNPAQNLTVECDGQGNTINIDAWLQSNAGALATDICGSVSWSNDYNNNLSDLCGGTGSVTVTFTVTDECGNTTPTTATFTIQDTTSPSIGIEATNLIVDCDGAGNISDVFAWLDNKGGAGATDLCSNVSWSNNYSSLSDDCGATGSASVTFTATDECGNTSQTTATVTVVDNIPPTISSPAMSQTVECDGQGNQINIDAWLNSIAGALATDVCGQNVTWSNDYSGLSDECGGTGSATVTFTATDECGNTSQTTATFTIEDTTAPSIGIFASNQIVECDGNGNSTEIANWLNNQGGAGANDLCGNVTWSNNYTTLSDECGSTGAATVVFTATDDCGNTSQTTATFTVVDNTPPVIVTAAVDQIVECDGQANQINIDFWLGGNAGALATDLCGGAITWTNDYTGLSDECGDTGSTTVTFTATDECGNTNQTVATFTIEDTTAPSIGIPASPLTVECDGNGNSTEIANWLNSQGGAGAIDICGSVSWSNDYNTVSDDCGATGTTSVTFTATDECGNTSQTTATISIIDNTPPTIVSGALDQLVECDGQGNQINIDFWLNAFGGALATDVCSQNITWTNDYNGLSDECGDTGSATVTFTASDECGNTSQTTATFTVEDTTPPSIGIPAANAQAECDGNGNSTEIANWLNNQGGAGANDLCGNVTWSNNYNTLSDECGSTGAATVVFTATDDCGNTSQTTATFTVVDNTPPVIVTTAVDQIVECDGQGNQINIDFWLGGNAGALATDLCGGAITWTNDYSGLSDECGDTGSTTVIFTATDECGNTNQTIATFTVEDTTAPSIGIPASPLTVECDGNGNSTEIANWLNSQGGAGAIDLCGSLSWSNDYNGLSDECGSTGSRTVIFTATDDCGNTSQTTATVTVNDNTPPTIVTPAQNQLVECDGQGNQINIDFFLNSYAGALATDACSQNITWTNDYAGLSDECGDTGSTTVTFTATDECGNTSETTATFTIQDNTAPSIGIPATDQVVECDGNGNSTELADWLNSQGGAGATDICGSVSWSNNYTTLSDECGNTGSATVVFTAVDECGNASQTAATFTVVDNIAPSIVTAAVDQVVECDGQGNQINIDFWLNGNAGALATDACSNNITWTNNYNGLSNDCSETGSATVTFTATDECGNTSETIATFTITDTTPPDIGIPATNLLVQCDGNGNSAEIIDWLNIQGGAGAFDLCGGTNWSNDFTGLSDDCAASGTALVTFTVADDCGNIAQTTASIIVEDNTPPTIVTSAVNQIVECDGQGNQINIDFWLDGNAGALATDACGGNISWTNNYTGLSDECGDTGSATVTFTATDECGNVSETTATFTIQDSTPPSIGIPAQNAQVECDGGGNGNELFAWLDNQGGAGAFELCGNISWSNNFSGSLSDECGTTGSTTVTFTVTDECGNASETTATFTIVDNTAPVLAQAAINQTVECDGQGNQVNLDFWLAANGNALATDLCGGAVTWTNNYNNAPVPECDSIPVTFTGTDECGNSVETTAWFIVLDSTPPQILNVPEDMSISCEDFAPGTTTVVATDLCDNNVPAILSETSTQGTNANDCSFYNYQINRTWSAIDNCGNEALETQIITVEDITSPNITFPAQDLIAECAGAGNQAALNDWLTNNGGATANDNCSAVSWTNDYNGNLDADCGQTGSTTVTFTASDVCGNTIATTATFTVIDTSAPNIVGVPTDVFISCEQAIPTPATVAATDACDTNVEVTSSDVSTQGNDPYDCSFYTYNITRTWIATDDCGNTASANQTISISDVLAPVIGQQATNTTVECDGNGNNAELMGWLNNNGGATATDNCSPIIWANDFAGGFGIDCGNSGQVTVTFLAKDACGNVTPTVAIFTIIDSTSPTLLNVPANTTMNCDEVMPPMATVTATDLCDTNVDITPSEFSSQGMDPTDCSYYQYSITRTWTATDDCGNTTTATQLISVSDTSSPEITQGAEDAIVECDGTGNAAAIQAWIDNNGGAIATDNCSQITWANDFAGNLGLDCGNSGQVTVTFLAKDACGNVTPTVANFIINDTTAPSILGVPADANITCNEPLPGTTSVTATDLCTPSVNLVLDNESTQGNDINDCSFYNYEVIRTWTATDACGNTATATQMINVSDNTAPEMLTLAQGQTMECTGNANAALTTWLNNNGGAAAQDNCSAVVWSNDYNGSLDIDCGQSGTVTVTFTAADVCGATTETTATFTIEDTTAPELLNIPYNMNITCSEPVPDAPNVVANDLCDANVALDFDDNSTQSSDPNDCNYYNYEIIRTWTATDDCGNTATASQTISVSDNTAPQITQIALGAQVECDGNGNQGDLDNWLNTYGGAIALDDCSSVNWTNDYNGNLTPACGMSGSTSITFTAMDACGNEMTTTATFTVVDNMSPTLIGVPANDIIACDGNLPSPSNVTANDLCDTNVEVLLNETNTQTNNPNECSHYNFIIIRTWTAIDDCGNSSQASQSIEVSDQEAPTITTPAQDVTVDCDGIGNTGSVEDWLNNHGSAVANDNCSDVFWSHDFSGTVSNDCGASGSVTVTFTAHDACGNETTTSATFTISDDSAPSLVGVPSDISVSCNNIPAMATVLGNDLCDTNVEVIPSEDNTQTGNSNDCEYYNYTITRTWIATDDCGNTASASQTITVSDNDAPQITTAAQDLTLECDGTGNGGDLSNWLSSGGGAIATDDCSAIVWTNDFNGDLNILCGQSGSVSVTFIATDACGNEAATSATFIVEDTSGPQLLSVPFDVTVSCGAIPDVPNVLANDLCDTDVDVLFNEINYQGGSPDGCNYYNYDIVRTWTATDDCDNTSEATQTITVTDNVPPEITSPAIDAQVECDGNGNIGAFIAWLDNAGGAIAQDDCSTVNWANNYMGDFLIDCAGAGQAVVVFSATDICGNISTTEAVFEVIDTTEPILLGAPSDISVECDNVPPAINLTATDICDTDVDVLVNESIQPIPGCAGDAYEVTRIWVATDACGNSAEATQVVTVSDNTPPVLLGVPDDLISGCNDDIPDIPTINTDVTATDNCDGFVQITFSEQMIPGNCGNSFTLIRTWTAIDNCGNVDAQSQIIAVGDDNAPQFTVVPDNITLECPNTATFAMAEATDDCNQAFVTYNDNVIQGACPQSYIMVRTWTASDSCGNFSTISRTITVEDNTAPTLIGVPGNITVDLTAGQTVPDPAIVFGNDICDTDVEIIFTELETNFDCSYVLSRVWEAIDDCGNVAIGEQEITVLGGLMASIEGDSLLLVGNIATLTAAPFDPTYTYSWTASGGQLTNANTWMPNFSADLGGLYTLEVEITTPSGCSGTTTFTILVVNAPNPIASSNGPVCIGENIELTASGGNTYTWTGPNGFTSTEQNPIIEGVTLANAGTYTLTITIGQEQTGTSVLVEIFDSPSVNIEGANILCFGDQMQLFASGGTDFSWSGPNGYSTTGPVISIPNIGLSNAGTYFVTVTDSNGCQAKSSITVSVGESLPIEASNNGPLCAGQTLELYATEGADSYFWEGPGGFTSTEQNPVIPNVPLIYDGIFTVTATGGTCTGTAFTGVEIKISISATAGDNGPICEGESIELFATGGTSFEWSGPNNFTSTDDDPTIINATTGNAGTYQVIVGTGICTDTLEVLVEVAPSLTADYNIIPADCNGLGFINLGVSGGSGNYTFDWADLPGTDDPEDRSDVVPGSYAVTISDDNGCDLVVDNLLVGDFCGCDANSGNINPDTDTACFANGSAILSATLEGDQVVPSGYTIAYILTIGSDLTITAINTSPFFSATELGEYTIHTLVYDPVTLDLSFIQFGQTQASELLDMILQGGGDICAMLDVSGATIEVLQPSASLISLSDADCGICNGVAVLFPSTYNYNWSDGGAGANRNDLCAGSYNIIVTDNNDCTTTLSLNIEEDCSACDAPVVLNVVVVESNCGESTGSAMIELNANPANYVYTWNPNTGTSTGSGNARTDLAAGIYTVTISDPLDPDCATVIDFPVGISDGPVVDDIISIPATCSMPDGSITLLPTSFDYIWVFDGFNGNSRTDLTSGSFDVVVVDPANPACPDIITVEVGQINNLSAEAVVNNQPTCGEANGTVTINLLSGGSNNLSFQWSNGGTNVTENNLASGTYGVLITDNDSGCTFNLIFTLTDDVAPAFVEFADFYEVSCVGSTDGNATFTVGYSIDFVQPANIIITGVGAVIYQNGQLGPGQYCIVVIDGNGCIAGTGCFNVISPAALEVDVAVTNASCLNDGAISVMVSGGNPAYTFDWEDLPGNDDPMNRQDLSAGEYNLTVTDDNGCTAIALNLQVTDDCVDCQNPPVLNNIVIVESNCDNSDGAAILNVASNPSDYTYTWDPDLGQANALGNSRSNLPAGTYSVTISDINDPDCFIIETFSIGNADGPSVSVEAIEPSACTTNNGAAKLTNIAGYTYSWSDGGFGPERFDLGAIVYQVTVTDVATGCFTIVEVDIPAINNLEVEINANTLPDCNSSNGSITADVTNGSGSYFYSWGPNATLDNLSAGIYELTVTDLGTGCTVEEVYVLDNNVVGATVTLDPIVEMSCAGANNGLNIFSIAYDPGFNFPESVSIVDANGNIVTNGQLGIGTYCLIVEDAAGCLAGSACFDVVSPDQLDVDVSIDPYTCQQGGNILLSVSGSNGPYTFDWADLPGTDDPGIRLDLQAGGYSVTITDANGCEAAIDNLIVGDECIITPTDCEEPEIVNINKIASTCGNANGAASITLTGDVADYTYNWNPNVSTTNTANNLPSGVYSVTIANANDSQCFTEISFSITNADGPIAEVLGTTPATCAQANGTGVLSPTSYFYEWCNGGGGFNGINLPAGICFVTVTDPTTGCTNILEVEIESINLLQTEAIIDAAPDCSSDNGSVTISVSGGSTNYQFAWDDGGNTQTRDNLGAGVYTVTVTDLGSTGCINIITFVLLNELDASATITLVDDPVLVKCAGDNNGFADYNVILDPGFLEPASVEIVDSNNEVQTNGDLSPGNYCILVSDANGCLAGSACFDVEAPDGIDVAVNIIPYTCMLPGSITLDVSGGNGTYTYDWADLLGNDDPANRTDLQAATYSVTVTDIFGCTSVANNLIVLDECNPQTGCQEPEVINIVKVESTCGNNNGAATIMLSGDEVVDYTYTWSPNVSTSNAAIGIPSGVYMVTITDVNDDQCTTEISLSIGNTNGPQAEVVGTTPATCFQNNGTAVVSPVGYIYEWCNGGGGFNGINLPAGICFVTVTDPSSGCTNILEVEIEAINVLMAEAQTDTEPDCGFNNGAITILVSGGSANYSFTWSDGGNSQTRNDLEAGMYTVTVSDLGVTGCTTTVTFVLLNKVTAGATVDLAADTVSVTCAGDSDGFISFTINTEPGFADPAVTEIVNVDGDVQVNGNLSSGSYCVIVTDANDCIAGSACFEVISPDAIDVNVALMNKTCDTLGVIELTVTGGTMPYTFDWADLPGSDDPMNRIGLEAGGYVVTLTDANGCTVVAMNLPIADVCALCPSPDTVDLILPVFTVDSFCVEIETCFDTLSTTFELMAGGFSGSSSFGFWSLDAAGCLFYTSTGIIGNDVDTIYIIANDNGLMDTTCIFVTITPPCFGLTGLDSVSMTTFDCDLGGSFCLPVPLTDIGLYSFTDNGLPYTGGFAGCDFQTLMRYELQGLFDVVATGPWSLDSWIVNSDTFALDTFNNLAELVVEMNVWDPTGGWYLGPNNTIVGGNQNNIYGEMDFTHLLTGITINGFFIITIDLPVGSLMTVDTGYHEIVMTELTTGCLDTLFVEIICNPCPELYSGPPLIETTECDDLTAVCLDIDIDNVDNYLVTDNGTVYTVGFQGCDYDSLYAYLAIDFIAGTYTVDSWIVNNDTFSMTNFSSLQELVDSMNVWDPAANWVVNGVLLVGGDFSNFYGELIISQNGTPIAMVDTAPQLIPNGVAVSLEPGIHEVILTDTITGCIDTVNIEIACVACNEHDGPGILYVFNCNDDAELCLDIPAVNANNYVFTDNGLPYTGSLLGCDFDTLFTYLAIDFATFGGYTVDSWTLNGTDLFFGFFTSLDELVFWMNNVDPNGNWSVNGLLIVGGNTANSYGDLVITEAGMPVVTVQAQIQLTPNGIALTLSLGSHEVIVTDTIIGCTDTINLVVQCLTENLPDTIYLDVLNGFTDTFCIDISYLPGDLDTIYNFCEDANVFEVNAEIFLLDTLACFDYTGLEVGQDTACFAFCDDLGNCDTLYVVVNVIPPTVDTINTTVILTDTDTLCLDVSEIPGDLYTITNFCPGESSDFVVFSSAPDTFCVYYTGVAIGIDTACFEICDQFGYCDTTILIVETIIDPDGIGPIAIDDDTTGIIEQATIINVLTNDTLNGDLADISILTDPANGAVVVNPDFTISYIPDVGFCGSLDSFEYILTTSSGSDTAFVFIDVYCDMLTIYTGFSPNGDGVNDSFTIKGIDNFPNNEVRIYNRWGNEVFFKKGYTNADGWFGGWKGKDLPDGTYFYLIEDGEGQQYSGYVQIHR